MLNIYEDVKNMLDLWNR